MLDRINTAPTRLKICLLMVLLFVSGTVILAHWKGSRPASANEALIPQGDRPAAQLEAELVTITPTGFEPAETTRPQGRFLLAVDNRSGLDEVDLYFEGETGARLSSTPTRKRKVAWRDVIDLPPGTYFLRAANDESWRCRITLTPR